MTKENIKIKNGRRATEEHDRTKRHKQNCKLTCRMPEEDYKSTGHENNTRNDRIQRQNNIVKDRFRMPSEHDR